jgi:prolyl oligopeptidase PreP (S9A serine peptidase family)
MTHTRTSQLAAAAILNGALLCSAATTQPAELNDHLLKQVGLTSN